MPPGMKRLGPGRIVVQLAFLGYCYDSTLLELMGSGKNQSMAVWDISNNRFGIRLSSLAET